jgi:hypothetical protein
MGQGVVMPLADQEIGIPGQTLTTWNLLNSAASFERHANNVPWPSIEDLCALVDLFCLYDTAGVINRHSFEGAPPELIAAISDEKFIYTYNVGASKDTFFGISSAAAMHLAAFLHGDLDDFAGGVPDRIGKRWDLPLFEHVLNTGYADSFAANQWTNQLIEKVARMSYGGHTWDPDRWGPEMSWVDAVEDRNATIHALMAERSNWTRSNTFVLRTFLYLAYADVKHLPFVPDAARRPIMQSVVREENQFRERLRSELKKVVSETTPGVVPHLRKVSPLAAIVFERSRGRRYRLVPEMVKLRTELKPLRTALSDLEHSMLYAPSRDEAMNAKGKWERALREVQRNFGDEPGLLSGENALGFGQRLSEALDAPQSFSAWFGAIIKLPVEALSRLVARRTLVDLHRLRPDLPSSGRLYSAINSLFGL